MTNNNNLKDSKSAFVNLQNNDAIASYVKGIIKFKRLTAKEEFALFEIYNNPNSSEVEKAKAREEIINRNQRFVYSVAKKYAQDETLLDLIGEGNLGLMEAFDCFDYTRGIRLCTHAVWYIRRAINAYLTTGNMLIKKSNNTKTLSKVMDIQEKFFQKEGRYAVNSELIEILNDVNIMREEYGIDVSKSLDLKKESDLFELKIDMLNSGYDDEDEFAFENSKLFVSHASESEDCVYNSESENTLSTINTLKGALNATECKVIDLAFGDDELSNKEIAEIIGLSDERVRQIKNKAIEKMHDYAEKMHISAY